MESLIIYQLTICRYRALFI